jgi:hypothetical protein
MPEPTPTVSEPSGFTLLTAARLLDGTDARLEDAACLIEARASRMTAGSDSPWG